MLTRFGARSLRKLKRAVRLSKAGLKKRTRLVRADGISSSVFPTDQRMVMEHLSSRANREFLEALLKEISGREWALKFSLKENLPAKTPAAKSKNAPAIVREALEMFKGEIKT